MQILKNGQLVLEGKKEENGLYVVNIDVTGEALMTQRESENINWHRKLGHLNFIYLKKVPNLCEGIPKITADGKEIDLCEVCIKAKQTRQPFNSERERAVRPLQIMHSDVCGPIDPET